MATYKVLGQSTPTATTNTDLYTVPSGKQTVCSTLVIANRSVSGTTFRIAVRPAGAALADQHYIAYDTTIAANDSIFLTLGVTLAETDVVTVYTSANTLSFNLFGSEL
jgi:hypothetical protein